MSRNKDVIERWEKQVSTPDSVTKKVIFPTDEQQFEPLETVLENLVRHEDDKAGQKGGQVTNVLLISVEGGGLEEQLEDFRRDGKKSACVSLNTLARCMLSVVTCLLVATLMSRGRNSMLPVGLTGNTQSLNFF